MYTHTHFIDRLTAYKKASQRTYAAVTVQAFNAWARVFILCELCALRYLLRYGSAACLAWRQRGEEFSNKCLRFLNQINYLNYNFLNNVNST